MPLTVHVPSPVHSYTRGQRTVAASGESLAALLEDLDRQFPGIRFRLINEQDRIREHIKIFINKEQVHSLSEPLRDADEVHIIAALSGG